MMDKVPESFTEKDITIIHGVPAYVSLENVLIKINTNASSVHSDLGDGWYGLYALTAGLAGHIMVTGVTFVPPVNPRPTATIPRNSSEPVNSRLTNVHKHDMQLWNEYTVVDNALKR